MPERLEAVEHLRSLVEQLCQLAAAGHTDELAAARRQMEQALDGLAADRAVDWGERDKARKAADRAESQALRLRELLEHGPDGYIVTDHNGLILEANHAAAELLGRARSYLIRKPLSVFIEEGDLPIFRWRVNNARRQDRGEWSVRLRPRNGRSFTAGVTVTAFEPRAGEPADLRWLLRDISALERAEELAAAHEFSKEVLAAEQQARSAAETAQRRLELVAGASHVLAASLDHAVGLSELAALVVPAAADLFLADVFSEETLEQVTLAHVDPITADRLRGKRRPPADLAGDHPIAQVLRTGQPLLLPEVTSSWLRSWAGSDDALSLWVEVGLTSATIIPIRSDRQTHGALSFAYGSSGRRYEPADLKLLTDIGLRVALALDTLRLIKDLEAQHRQRDQFLAMLAHELRNPLAAVTNGLDVLDRVEPSRRGHVIDIIGRQARHLARLLNDLLDVSRVRFGQVPLQRQRVDLRELARQSLAMLQAGAEGGGRAIRFHAVQPVVVLGDADRLEQVIANLLDNAVKYTPSGGTIEVWVGEEGAEAVVRVRDSGVGIAPEFLPRVFDVFSRADRPPSESRPGLGLGLSVVRDLIAKHGGSITVSSPGVGQGSEFTIRLPLAPAEEELPAAPPATPPAAARSILIVEDNEDARDALRMALELSGQHVKTARDGAEAIRATREHPPEVAVIDIGLPDMDGYQVARTIRAQPGGDGVHLIALTGYGQPADRERALRAGFDSHLIKPVDPAALIALIAQGCSSRPGPVPSSPTAR